MQYFQLYSKWVGWVSCLQSPLLLVIRLFWGWSFLMTGIGKFMHMDNVITFFTSLGIPFPALNAYVAASIETIGGACLLLGIASRIITIPLIFTMIIAFVTADSAAVHAVFADPQNFIHRTPFSFLFASLLILVFGPGVFSVDYWFWKKRHNVRY